MAANTSIEWAANADGTPGATWNPIRAHYFNGRTTKHGFHCVHASEGCRFCYAETLNVAARFPGVGTGLAYTKQNEAKVTVYLDADRLAIPLRRRKPTTYFLSSMTDVFADFVSDADLDRLFAVMGFCEQHTFIVLTKRSDRMRAYCNTLGQHHERDRVSLAAKQLDADMNLGGRGFWYTLKHGGAFLPNVWLVVSVEDQANVGRVIDLVNTPAAVRGVSYEPALGPLVLDRRCMVGDETYWDFLRGVTGATLQHVVLEPHKTPRIDWVICGGESGRNARPMHPDWARSLRDQCAAAGVPFFFKQHGEWAPENEFTGIHPDACYDEAGRERFLGRAVSREGAFLPAATDGSEFMRKCGKARAGRKLDGRTHDERPKFHEVAGRKGEAGLLATTASPGSQKP